MLTLVPALVPALLLAGAVLVAGGLPRAGPLRLRTLTPLPEPTPSGTGWQGRLVVAAALVLVVVLGVGSTLAVGLAALAGRHALRQRARSRSRETERLHAVEACAALAGELRAGRVPADALEVAAGVARGPFRAALRTAAAGAELGADVAPALLAAAQEPTAVPEVLRGLAACWQVCSRTGSGLADAVDRLTEALRSRHAQQRAVAASLAGPRASAGVLALLPLAGIALAAGLGARPLHVLLHTPLGLVCLVLGVGLDALGLWWTGRIVQRAAGT